MDASDSIRTLAARSGHSLRSLSQAAGRSPYYVSAMVGRSSAPGLDTAALLASVAGYSLAFIPADQVPAGAIVIDPPTPAQASQA